MERFLQQKKVEEQIKLARVKEELAKQTKDALSDVQNKTQFLKKVLSVEEINHRLGEAMNRKTLNPDKIVLCQRKITMGLKRKTELNKNLRKLE